MDVTEQRALLRQVAILAPLSDAELNALLTSLTWSRVIADEEVVSHLSGGTHVYFIAQGAFLAQLTPPHGRSVAIRRLHAGGHFGEIAALTGAPRTVSVIAESDGLVAECPADEFCKLMLANAAFAQAIAASLARNVVFMTDRLFELAALEVRFRIYSELLRLTHGGDITDQGVIIRNAPTHEMIAATIGAQREAVTRELRYLASEGVLHQSKREIVIGDIDRLRQMVERRAGLTATQVLDWRF